MTTVRSCGTALPLYISSGTNGDYVSSPKPTCCSRGALHFGSTEVPGELTVIFGYTGRPAPIDPKGMIRTMEKLLREQAGLTQTFEFPRFSFHAVKRARGCILTFVLTDMSGGSRIFTIHAKLWEVEHFLHTLESIRRPGYTQIPPAKPSHPLYEVA